MEKRDVGAMRDWIADCWEDVDVDGLTVAEVLAAIERHYDGGLAQFTRDA